MPETIDVAVIARNEEGMIADTLTSINNQVLDGRYQFNVTVWPNACTDHTAEVARKTIASFASKKRSALSYAVVEREQGGKNLTLNTALAGSKTDLFIYTDGDVTFSDNCFTAVADKLHEPGVVVSGAVSRKVIAPGTDPVVAKFHTLRQLLYDAYATEGYVRQPMGAMMGFRRMLLDEIPLEALAEDLYVVLLAAARFGVAASQAAPEAIVYGVATQTMDDYVGREKRIWVANQKLVAQYPEFKEVYEALYVRHHPRSREQIDERLLPLLAEANLTKEDLEHWHNVRADINQTAELKDFLRPDGSWVPIESTKRIS